MAARSIRVLTLNCLFHGHVRARLQAIGPLLNEGQFDLVCLQEVAFRRHARLLASLAPSYRPPIYRPFGIWATGGLVTFARTEVRRNTYELFRRRGAWGTLGAVDSLGRKGFLTAWLELLGRPVVLVNTHLLANYDEDWSPTNRFAIQQRDELDQLGDALCSLDENALLLVAGDFNVPAGNPMLVEFAARTGLRNAMATPAATYRGVRPEAPGQQIDHIFYRHPPNGSGSVSARLRLEERISLPDGRRMFASDHFGVEAQVDFE